MYVRISSELTNLRDNLRPWVIGVKENKKQYAHIFREDTPTCMQAKYDRYLELISEELKGIHPMSDKKCRIPRKNIWEPVDGKDISVYLDVIFLCDCPQDNLDARQHQLKSETEALSEWPHSTFL